MNVSRLPMGIDVSNHQGRVDWDAVKHAGILFMFAKATEGTFFNDSWFARNWQEAKRVGIPRGAYHYARPSQSLPEHEAAFFLASVNWAGGLEPGDMLVLDIEDEHYHTGGPYGSAGAWSLGFCQYIEAATGVIPIVYTGPWYTESRDFSSVHDLKDYPLWIAAYQAQMPPPPPPWEFVSFWQYTSSGLIPGVAGDCDVNFFNGSADRIPLLGLPGELEEPPPPPPTYVVGPGILAAMAERYDAPSTNEHYLTPDWSEAYGQTGIRYVYIASLNKVFVYHAG